ncbi:MAG: translation initiation factor IF-2 N-terminal domain-containing protein, partial [Selenomonas sp.]|nr:translation initiation factor IF-2 N-terminal domain-containing protein [Selenomonas sp.]
MSEAKYRITDLAKEFKTDKGTIIDILKSKNYKVKNMFSAVGEEERAAVKAELGRTAKPVRKEALPSKAAAKPAAPKTTAPKKPAEKADDAEKPAEQPEVKAPSAPAEEKERPV